MKKIYPKAYFSSVLDIKIGFLMKNKIKAILKAIKTFFRQILLFGNDKAKEATTNEIIAHYDNKTLIEKM